MKQTIILFVAAALLAGCSPTTQKRAQAEVMSVCKDTICDDAYYPQRGYREWQSVNDSVKRLQRIYVTDKIYLNMPHKEYQRVCKGNDSVCIAGHYFNPYCDFRHNRLFLFGLYKVYKSKVSSPYQYNDTKDKRMYYSLITYYEDIYGQTTFRNKEQIIRKEYSTNASWEYEAFSMKIEDTESDYIVEDTVGRICCIEFKLNPTQIEH